MENTVPSNTTLHLTDYGAPYAGNFIASMRALERLLGEHGDRMVYVLPPRASERAWTREMAKTHDVRFLDKGGFFSYMRQVRRLLKETGANILHEHFIHFTEKIAAMIACATCGHKVKVVLHLHNHIVLPRHPLPRLPHMLYFRSVSRFVCCSESVAAHLIADGVKKERVCVAENAIAFERLDAFDSEARASLPLPQNAKFALMFGYNYEVKGVDIAVEAVRQLRKRINLPVVLGIVLSSNLETVKTKITQLLNKPELPDWIILLPPREDVASYYHAADVFLSPSRQEGFCYALIEAAYCRTPVLASAIDAQRDLALPQDAFFPPSDPAALSKAMERIVEAPQTPEQEESLLRTKERVFDRYSLARWAKDVRNAYEAIL